MVKAACRVTLDCGPAGGVDKGGVGARTPNTRGDGVCIKLESGDADAAALQPPFIGDGEKYP
jgi:hypothetical protein